VGTGTLLRYGESDIFPQAVAPILVDIVRAVEEETFLQVREQTSRASTRYPASDTAPRQRARYAFA
jgi:hypothetical protein